MLRLTKKERIGILLLAAILAIVSAVTALCVPDGKKPVTIPDSLSETVADTLTPPTESTINELNNHPAEHINPLKQKMKRQ
jgi:hypothetical protein